MAVQRGLKATQALRMSVLLGSIFQLVTSVLATVRFPSLTRHDIASTRSRKDRMSAILLQRKLSRAHVNASPLVNTSVAVHCIAAGGSCRALQNAMSLSQYMASVQVILIHFFDRLVARMGGSAQYAELLLLSAGGQAVSTIPAAITGASLLTHV
jgi:hypothetical protein